MLEVIREVVNVLHSLRAITANRWAELHTLLDQAAEDTAPAPAEVTPAPETPAA